MMKVDWDTWRKIFDEISVPSLLFKVNQLIDFNKSAQVLLNLNPNDLGMSQELFINPSISDQSMVLNSRFDISAHVSLQAISDVSLCEIQVNHTQVNQDKMREAFIANISHELRTPLTVFRGYLELLTDQIPRDRKTLVDIFKQMNIQSRRMGVLVENLLLLSRLETNDLSLDEQDSIVVSSMLKDICASARQLGFKKNISIQEDYDDHLSIKACGSEIYSALSNVIYNAVHYSKYNGCVKVNWFKQGKYALLQVEDNGIGIPKNEINFITQRFYRVDKARSWSKAAGTGLGLAIVKHVMIRHGGYINIESDVGKGSCFTLHFPRS